MTITLLDRYKGAMVGVHVGDSIGAPYETWGPRKIATDIDTRGGLKFFEYPNPWVKDRGEAIMPIGRPTDDSDQTADLACSLIECDGLNPEHLREALRDSVVRNKSRLWSGVSDGAGGTTRKALSDDPEKVEAARTNNIGTNGSLMRSVPMALWLRGELSSARFFNSPTKTFHHPDNIISDMSAVTHNHWHSKIYCHALSYVLENADDKYFNPAVMMEKLSYRFKPLPLFMRIHNSLNDEYMFPIDPGTWPARGTAEFSLYAALWCFKHSTSFEDGIEKAIRIGGDTDTYAAIAGGLLGAYYGYDAIPVEWRDACLGRDVMLEYADKLYEMNQRL
jgi:ADP-ribosyl-[dinitrogen reductase] hydrolase